MTTIRLRLAIVFAMAVAPLTFGQPKTVVQLASPSVALVVLQIDPEQCRIPVVTKLSRRYLNRFIDTPILRVVTATDFRTARMLADEKAMYHVTFSQWSELFKDTETSVRAATCSELMNNPNNKMKANSKRGRTDCRASKAAL